MPFVISAAGINGWVLGLWLAAILVFLIATLGVSWRQVNLIAFGLALTVGGLIIEAGTTIHSISW